MQTLTGVREPALDVAAKSFDLASPARRHSCITEQGFFGITHAPPPLQAAELLVGQVGQGDCEAPRRAVPFELGDGKIVLERSKQFDVRH